MRMFVMTLAVLATASPVAAAQQTRLTPKEMSALPVQGAVAGTSGVSGAVTTVLSGDPNRPGLYTIRLSVPPHTTIQAHSHRDERTAVVVSGPWWFGYGPKADPKALKRLEAGSFYTEPAGQPHFARTGDAPAVVYITGVGPTDTTYVDPNERPGRR